MNIREGPNSRLIWQSLRRWQSQPRRTRPGCSPLPLSRPVAHGFATGAALMRKWQNEQRTVELHATLAVSSSWQNQILMEISTSSGCFYTRAFCANQSLLENVILNFWVMVQMANFSSLMYTSAKHTIWFQKCNNNVSIIYIKYISDVTAFVFTMKAKGIQNIDINCHMKETHTGLK